jgi:hypothetical protein
MFPRPWFIAGAMALTAVAAAAQTATTPAPTTQTPQMPHADQRSANEQARIKEGRESGQLTPEEHKRLEAEQHFIKQKEKRDKADGVVTPEEKQHLNHLQNMESKDIKHQKNDKQTRAEPPAK